MTDNEWMTVSEASEKVNIPVETLRRYLRHHNVHLKVKKLSKKYYIHNDSMTVIEEIRRLYAEGKNIEEVEESLSASGVTMTLTVKNDDDETMTVHVADELKSIKEQLEQQKQFNQALLEKLEEQNGRMERYIENRDREVMTKLNQIQASHQALLETASTQEPPKKKGFFSRLFGK
jgi:DNA-binding transcriptional MerR regulator